MIVIDSKKMSGAIYQGLREYLNGNGVYYEEGSLINIKERHDVINSVYERGLPEDMVNDFGESTVDNLFELVERSVIYDNGFYDKIDKEAEEILHTYAAMDKYGVDELWILLDDLTDGRVTPIKGDTGYDEVSSANYIAYLSPTGNVDKIIANGIGPVSYRMIDNDRQADNR